ncbi:hypothetical protein JHK87_016204 [Glycine soja]|nr:hypothetical protein JHK87_016204 [Glycine soja]
MESSSASVFVVNKQLFWGFDDDCNDVVVIMFFVNDRDVLSMCQIGLADSEKEVHVYLENADPERGPVSDIGLVIEVHAMPINCSAENVVEAVAEECTHNDIEDMDVDVAKGGSDDEN